MNGDTRRGGSRGAQPTVGPPRRLFVIGAGAATLAFLTDRGLRLDLPQPPPPVPTRRPATDETLLVSIVRDIANVRARLAAAPASAPEGRVTSQVRALLAEQQRILTGRLTNAGVPTNVIAAPSTASATSVEPTAATTAGARAGVAQLLVDSVPESVWKPLTSATAATRALCSAAYTLRLAGAARLGHDVPLTPPGAAQPRLAGRSSALAYAFEVVAAQSSGSQREQALSTLAELRTLEREVGADSAAGWALPFEVTTPAAARRLATHSLGLAIKAGTDLAEPTPDAVSLSAAAHWTARAAAIAVPWGIPLTAFPGTGV